MAYRKPPVTTRGCTGTDQTQVYRRKQHSNHRQNLSSVTRRDHAVLTARENLHQWSARERDGWPCQRDFLCQRGFPPRWSLVVSLRLREPATEERLEDFDPDWVPRTQCHDRDSLERTDWFIGRPSPAWRGGSPWWSRSGSSGEAGRVESEQGGRPMLMIGSGRCTAGRVRRRAKGTEHRVPGYRLGYP